jgi:hypothetical protein
MYFLSGDEMCGTVRPAFCATSSNCGRGSVLASSVFCTGAFIGAAWAASNVVVSRHPAEQEKIHDERGIRIRRAIIQAGGPLDLAGRKKGGCGGKKFSRAKQNAPDSFESQASVDQPSPKCCSRTTLSEQIKVVHGPEVP